MATHDVIVNLLSKAQGDGFKSTSKEADDLAKKMDSTGSKIEQRFQAIGSNGKLMGAAVGIGGAVAAVALTKFASASVDAFVNLGTAVKSFQRIAGGTSEDVSALIFALKRVGVEPDVAAKAFFQLSKRLGSGQVDLAKYGVEVKKNADGSVNMKDAVLQLSGAFSHMDANDRALKVMQLFGKQGKDLLPLLSKTRTEIQGIFDLAGKDHAILSDKDRDKALAYKKSMAELNLAMQGFQIQVGGAVIPVLEDLDKILTVVASTISDNADTVGVLAEAIGIGLAGALAILGVQKIGSIFIAAKDAVVGFTAGIRLLIGGTEAAAVAQGSLAASTALDAEAMAAFGVASGVAGAEAAAGGEAAAAGWLAVLGPVGLAVGAIVGLGEALHALDPGSTVRVGSREFRQMMTDGAFKADIQSKAIAKLHEILQKTPEKAVGFIKSMREAGIELGHSGSVIKAAGLEIADTGVKLGNIKIPDSVVASFASDKTGKAFQKFTDDLKKNVIPVLGEFGTAALLNSGIVGQALDDIAKSTVQTDKAIESSFTSATNVVGAFGKDTAVSGQDFINKLKEMNTAAHDFAGGLQIAAAAGVDQGILKSIAEAGPKALPELKGLLDAVAHGGLQAINQTAQDSNSVLATIVAAINGRIVGDAAAGAQWGNAVGAATGNAFAAALGTYVAKGLQGAVDAIHIIFGAIGSGGGAPTGKSKRLPGGQLAAGGPVIPGKTYLVGENGPEIFTSGTAGRILSHQDSLAKLSQGYAGSNGGTVQPIVVNVNALVADANTGRRIAEAIRPYLQNGGKI